MNAWFFCCSSSRPPKQGSPRSNLLRLSAGELTDMQHVPAPLAKSSMGNSRPPKQGSPHGGKLPLSAGEFTHSVPACLAKSGKSTMAAATSSRNSRPPKQGSPDGDKKEPDSLRQSAGEFTDVQSVPARVTEASNETSVTLPPEYTTLYVGPVRKVFKVPRWFMDYRSFKQLLKEERQRQKNEIVEDADGAIVLDSVKLEYFEFVKKSIEWKEREKRALEKSYCDALWTGQKWDVFG